MLEKQTKEIEGHVFTFNPLFAEQARRILVELVNRFGGSIAAGIEGISETEFEDVEENTDVIELFGQLGKSAAGVIREIVTNLKPQYYEDLTNVFGKRSEVKIEVEDGNSGMMTLDKNYRNHFFGTRLLLEAKWLFWCLEVQYSDFFGLVATTGQKAVAMKALKAMKSSSSFPMDSTGTSTESQVTPVIPAH